MNKLNLSYAGESNIGRSRSKNEDSYCLLNIPSAGVLLAAVADGIGGHSSGEIASYICCNELTSSALNMHLTPTTEKLKSFLNTTLTYINSKIFDRNFREKNLRPMGCTIVSALFTRHHIIAANAGDSRFYEFNGNELQQHSVDHLASANLQNSTKKCSPALIYRALGTHPQIELEFKIFQRNPASRYLLCSDGLYRFLPNSEICKIMGQSSTPREATNALIKTAFLTGTSDNITAICIYPRV